MAQREKINASAGIRPNSPRRFGCGCLSGLVLLIFALILGALLGYGLAYRSDYIFGSVYVAGIHVGNQTRAAAQRTLRDRWTRQIVTLTDGARQWTVTAADLGLQLDSDQALALAYAYGRDLGDPLSILTALTQRLDITPRWSYDAGRAAATLTALAPKINTPSSEARLEIVQGQAQATPGQAGQELDMAGTLAQWETGQASIVATHRAMLTLNAIEPVNADLSAWVPAANRVLATPPTLRGYDPVRDEWASWAVSAETWANWLTFQPENGRLTYSVNATGVGAFLAAQSAGLGEDRYLDSAEATSISDTLTRNQEPTILRIYHTPTTHTVQAGDTLSSIGVNSGIPYPWIQAANPGLDTLYVGQIITIPSPDDLIPLPPSPFKRIVVSLGQQHLWAYENGALKWDWVISTGITDSPTAPGVFQVQTHEVEAYASSWDLYMPYFMGIYLPAPNIDFMNGFHGFPTRDGRNLLWTGNLGAPVTYGCILVSNANVTQLYDWAEAGVVVAVVP